MLSDFSWACSQVRVQRNDVQQLPAGMMRSLKLRCSIVPGEETHQGPIGAPGPAIRTPGRSDELFPDF